MLEVNAILSPMMRQYLDLKAQNPDALLFFRLGDFYEMFFEDAQTCARELELTLTARDCGLEHKAPMCGVPWHAVDQYVARLLEKGYRVAIGEQMTDPAESKGLVERGVTRVISRGTVIEADLLEEKAHNYLACVHVEENRAGIAIADVSTGGLWAGQWPAARVPEELSRISPSELLSSAAAMDAVLAYAKAVDLRPVVRPDEAFAEAAARGELALRVSQESVKAFSRQPIAVCAAGALMDYLRQTQKNALSHFRELLPWGMDGTMLLDAVARRNLELTQSMWGRGRRGTLLSVLDKTKTAMGGRLLKEWVLRPLCAIRPIQERLDAVEALSSRYMEAEALASALSGVLDIERLCTRLAYGTFNARDAIGLGRSLAALPGVRKELSFAAEGRLSALLAQIDPLEDVQERIVACVADDPPLALKEGGLIREGFSKELDELRSASQSGKAWLASLEESERAATGIKNLKISYNRIFGYFIEVTKSNLAQVPYRYIRKQTVANGERYVTQELREMEEKILGAQEKAERLEFRLFSELRDGLAREMERLQKTARAVGELDALLSLALAAAQYGYTRPAVHDGSGLAITAGRHPVVAESMRDFVPNDARLTDEERLIVLTGPNMGGKSTYLRQVALIVLMAHIGSFVPAASASIPLTDRIFTRVGAQDDLAAGQSTFMVEMTEMAEILRQATPRSLLILDEVGRGTATFDGLSIAWAVVEHIASPKTLGAKTLFATHYHELSQLEGRLPGVVNCSVRVKETGEDVIFLHHIERGSADKSFGVQVAAIAGLPPKLVSRAREVLARLEAAEWDGRSVGDSILEKRKTAKPQQSDMFSAKRDELVGEIRELDVNALTPIDALNKLYLLREKARKV